MFRIKLAKFIWWIVVVLIVLIGLILGIFIQQKTVSYSLADSVLQVELVSSDRDMARGLSGRSEICANCAMLFSFPKLGNYGFWMKDMLFPIDLVWLKDDQVISCQTLPLFQGNGDLPRYWPPQPINRVLELNKGFCEAHSLQPGARLIRLD